MTLPDKTDSAQLTDAIEVATRDATAKTAHDNADVAERRYRDTLWVGHSREHESLREAISTALASVERERALHTVAHDAAHAAHEREHDQMEQATTVALSTVEREQALHVTAHDAAHGAHQHEHAVDTKNSEGMIAAANQDREVRATAHAKEHFLEGDARDKAALAITQRLEGMNEVRAQLKDQSLTFARREAVEALTDRIIAIEKLDIKADGRSLGQGAVIAAIVGSVGFAGTLLALIIVIANVVTKS